jgi:site-specific recombinase XerD
MVELPAMDSDLQWRFQRARPKREVAWYRDDPVLARVPSLAELAEANGTRDGQVFLVRSDGRVVAAVNAFLASRRMGACRKLTREKYARGLGVWLGYLDAVGRGWDRADAEDVAGFKFWRMTDGSNPARVAGSTVLDNLVAVNEFYRWAERRFGVANPVATRELRSRRRAEAVEGIAAAPHAVRDRDVKWLDPRGYAMWRDVGLRGLDRAGRDAAGWRGRNTQRDCAFADGLYGTGLRLAEWSSVLLLELPAEDESRNYYTCRLAAECGKGGRGRRYWMPASVLSDVGAYVEGERAAAVRRAQRAGRYQRLEGAVVLQRELANRRIELVDAAGTRSTVSLDALTPQERARILRAGPGGLEPAALWLSEDGLPRDAHSWSDTFDTANERVARAGLSGVFATAHILRHSFALRWFSVGRLLYEARFAHLDAEELRDFRAQFGDTWYLVKTLLGHADVSTTMDTYLEPFRDLDVELLIEHAHGTALAELMAEMFAKHPRVITAAGCGA